MRLLTGYVKPIMAPAVTPNSKRLSSAGVRPGHGGDLRPGGVADQMTFAAFVHKKRRIVLMDVPD